MTEGECGTNVFRVLHFCIHPSHIRIPRQSCFYGCINIPAYPDKIFINLPVGKPYHLQIIPRQNFRAVFILTSSVLCWEPSTSMTSFAR